ncbi:MAG: hypothetical protein WC511_05990 [Candidatus Pacearchaeota archaeon]
MDDEPPNVYGLFNSINEYYQDLLGYKPEQTSLKQIPKNKWDEFATQRGLNPNSSGIYLPRNQTSFIRDENPLSLFHEYFGHGLYCEQNLTGRKLVDLEKKLLEKEKQEFQNKNFTLEELNNFRRRNEVFNELDNFKQENLGRYELFAIWTEYLLSQKFNLKNKFEKKYDSLSNQEKEAVDSVINFSESYSDLATMYAQGMARRTTTKRVGELLREIYGNEKVNNSKLILLTGSKKPFSDIDLFASSNYLQEIKNDWLDLCVFDEEDFEKRIKLFEIQVTYPIMLGDFITGDEDYLKKKKKQLIEQPITEEAIKHNLRKSEEQKQRAEQYPRNVKEREVGLDYSKTYLANALMLKKGKRIFDLKKLKLYSQSENIKVKGGSE